MFRRQSVVAVFSAVLLGLVAVILFNFYLSGLDKSGQTTANSGTIKVAIAKVPIEFGDRVTAEKLDLVDWPASSTPAGSFRTVEELTAPGKARFAMRPIAVGEPVTASRLSGEGAPSIANTLGPDMRAASIRISDVAGVSGFVLPGDRVDVIITRGTGALQVADVLLSNVRVIAIDQRANQDAQQMTSGDAGALKTATLELSPADVQKVALGSSVGTLSLALRSPKTGLPGATQLSGPLRSSQLPGGSMIDLTPVRAIAAAPAAPQVRPAISRPRPTGPVVEVIRGGTDRRQYEVTPYVGF